MVEPVRDEVGVDLEVGPAQLVRLHHCPGDGSVPAVVANHIASVDEPPEKTAPPQFRVSYVPQGFRRVQGASGGMVFTDGVATLSIFVETKAMGNIQTNVGGTVLLSKQMPDASQQITVVGELPMAEARKVVESVEPVIY